MGMFDSVSNMFRRKKNDEQFGGEMNFANEQAELVHHQPYINQTEDNQQWHDIIQEYEIFKENYFKNPVDDPSTPDKIFIRDISELENKITEHIPKKVVEDEIVVKRIVEEDAFVKPLDFEAVREAPAQSSYANKMFEPAMGDELGIEGILEESLKMESHKVKKGNIDKEEVIMFNQAQQDEFFNEYDAFSGNKEDKESIDQSSSVSGFDDELLDYLFGESDSSKTEAEKVKENENEVKNRVFVFSDHSKNEVSAEGTESKQEESKNEINRKHREEDNGAFLEYFQELAGSGGSNKDPSASSGSNIDDSNPESSSLDASGFAESTNQEETISSHEQADNFVEEESSSEFADFFSDLMQSAVSDTAGNNPASEAGEGSAENGEENLVNRVFLQRGIEGESDSKPEETVRDIEKRSVVEKEEEGESSVVFSEVFTDAVKKADSDIIKDENAAEQIEEVVVKKKEVKQNAPSDQGESKSTNSKRTVEIEVDDPFSVMMNSLINEIGNTDDTDTNHQSKDENEESEFFMSEESSSESAIEKEKNETISMESHHESAIDKQSDSSAETESETQEEIKGDKLDGDYGSDKEEIEKPKDSVESIISKTGEEPEGHEVIVNHHYPRPVPVIVKEEVQVPFEKIVEIPEKKNSQDGASEDDHNADMSNASYIDEEAGWVPLSQTETLGIKVDSPPLIGDFSKSHSEDNLTDSSEKEASVKDEAAEIQKNEVTVIKEAIVADEAETPTKKKRRRRRKRKKTTLTPETIEANVLGVTEEEAAIKITDSEAQDTAEKVQIQQLEEVALPGEALKIHEFDESQTVVEEPKAKIQEENNAVLHEKPAVTVQALFGENFDFSNFTNSEEKNQEKARGTAQKMIQIETQDNASETINQTSFAAPAVAPNEEFVSEPHVFSNIDFFTNTENANQKTEPSPFDMIYDAQKLSPQEPVSVVSTSPKKSFFARLLAKIKEILFKERGKKKTEKEPILLDEEKADIGIASQESHDIREEINTLLPHPNEVVSQSTPEETADSSRRKIHIKGIVLGGVSGYDVVLENGSVVKNDISADNWCFCSPDAVINGNVEGAVVVIQGVVRGNISASVSLEIKAGAMVFGDVASPSLVIDESAMLQGNISKFENKL